MRGQRHAPAALYPGKTRYPLYRRLGGPQGRSGQMRKIAPPPGFDPRTVQPVASRCTDWATLPTYRTVLTRSITTPHQWVSLICSTVNRTTKTAKSRRMREVRQVGSKCGNSYLKQSRIVFVYFRLHSVGRNLLPFWKKKIIYLTLRNNWIQHAKLMHKNYNNGNIFHIYTVHLNTIKIFLFTNWCTIELS